MTTGNLLNTNDMTNYRNTGKRRNAHQRHGMAWRCCALFLLIAPGLQAASAPATAPEGTPAPLSAPAGATNASALTGNEAPSGALGGGEGLWLTGSAVPGGTQQLTRRPDGQYRFAGALNAGELKIMTTETFQKGTTQFLKPQLIDSYLINNGLNYSLTSDETQPGWVVSFAEDTYRILVDPTARRLTGELMLPWNEVLIAGSAFPGGSDQTEWKRDNMLPFVRSHDNPYVFTWEGELGIYQNVVEPGRFKLEGQMTWGPRELHPYAQGEDILTTTQVRSGGDDTKWSVTTPGTYRITVDLFNETIAGEIVRKAGETSDPAPPSAPEGATNADAHNSNEAPSGAVGGLLSLPPAYT